MRNSIIISNINKLPELTPSEQRVVLFLGTYFDGEKPSRYRLCKVIGMDINTLDKALEGLEAKGVKT